MATLQEIQARLDRGYFLKEDMETLGLQGYVSVAQMRAEMATLLIVEAPPVQVDHSAELRAEVSAAAAAKEAQERADREALIASIAEKQDEVKQEVLEQNQANEIADRFKEALKADPNVALT